MFPNYDGAAVIVRERQAFGSPVPTAQRARLIARNAGIFTGFALAFGSDCNSTSAGHYNTLHIAIDRRGFTSYMIIRRFPFSVPDFSRTILSSQNIRITP